MSIYPCRSCILFTCCSEICPKIESKNREEVQKSLDNDICPDCGSKVEYVQQIVNPMGTMSSKVCNNCNHAFSLLFETFLERYNVNRNL